MSFSAFPIGLDSITVTIVAGSSGTLMSAADIHSTLHNTTQDALLALETKVGIDGSADTVSLDWRVTNAETNLTDLTDVTNIAIRRIVQHYANAGNVTTGETDLYSDSLPAGTLAAAGYSLEAYYAGDFVSNATATRDLRVYFDGVSIYDSTAVVSGVASTWRLQVSIIRETTSVVRCIVTTQSDLGAVLAIKYSRLTGLSNLSSNAKILKITGQAGGVGAATNDIVARFGRINLEPPA